MEKMMARSCYLAVVDEGDVQKFKLLNGLNLSSAQRASDYVNDLPTFEVGHSEDVQGPVGVMRNDPPTFAFIANILQTITLIDEVLTDKIVNAIAPPKPFPLIQSETYAEVASSEDVRKFLDDYQGKFLTYYFID